MGISIGTRDTGISSGTTIYITRRPSRTSSTYNGSSYSPSDNGTAVSTSYTPVNFAGLSPIGQSQTIGMIQGMKEIEVKIEQIRLFNFTVNDFGDDNISPISGDVLYPDYRTWQYWNDPANTFYTGPLDVNGKPWRNISNAIYRFGWFNVPYHRGLYTRFAATIDTDAALSVKFKFGAIKGNFGSWTGNWEDYTFNFHWYLRHTPGNYFLYYDSSTDTWSRDSGTEATKYNTTSIPGTDFDDGNVSTEVSISIPIGEISVIRRRDFRTMYRGGDGIQGRSIRYSLLWCLVRRRCNNRVLRPYG